MFVSRTHANGGQTIEAFADHGMNAYVLCTTMKFDKTGQANFATDSYIRIGHSTNFGIEVSRQIPGLVAGFEGPCLYQEKRIIEQDLGWVDPEWLRGPSTNPTPSGTRLEEFPLSRMGHLPFFLKEGSFAHQVEYRFVWIVNYEPREHLDVKAPNARLHCQSPNGLTR
ncbi:MAG: hypothetical protein JNK74_02295 [Candidatus Hydrogenedentes bacterium]|nr:hypothetical protein [Candidatus Hydrogenedentota bacterium]